MILYNSYKSAQTPNHSKHHQGIRGQSTWSATVICCTDSLRWNRRIGFVGSVDSLDETLTCKWHNCHDFNTILTKSRSLCRFHKTTKQWSSDIWSFLNSCPSWPVGHWCAPKTSVTWMEKWCGTPSSKPRVTLTAPQKNMYRNRPTKKPHQTSLTVSNSHQSIKDMQSCLQLDLHQGSRHQPHISKKSRWRRLFPGRERENIEKVQEEGPCFVSFFHSFLIFMPSFQAFQGPTFYESWRGETGKPWETCVALLLTSFPKVIIW